VAEQAKSGKGQAITRVSSKSKQGHAPGHFHRGFDETKNPDGVQYFIDDAFSVN
jgi:hypothetical protein